MLSQKPKQVHTWAKVDGTFATFPTDRFFLLFSQAFIHPQYCPDGILQGKFIADEELGGGDWQAARWDEGKQEWVNLLVVPTHYSPQPEPPTIVEVDESQGFFRFRLAKGPRHTAWTGYTGVAYMDGVAAITGYYTDSGVDELVVMPAEQALAHIACGEELQVEEPDLTESDLSEGDPDEPL